LFHAVILSIPLWIFDLIESKAVEILVFILLNFSLGLKLAELIYINLKETNN